MVTEDRRDFDADSYAGPDRRHIVNTEFDGPKRRAEDHVIDRMARLETTVEELQKDLDKLTSEIKIVNDKMNEQNLKMAVSFSHVNETMAIMRLSAETLSKTIVDLKTAMDDIKKKQDHFTTIETMSKASWKTLTLVGTALVGVASVVAWLVEHFKFTVQ